ncbi:hypothetical protein QJS66_05270 [Kocuria rhizophila]|nr:hypothetical protein QJS66_05270 [Kocuria rhizophila]
MRDDPSAARPPPGARGPVMWCSTRTRTWSHPASATTTPGWRSCGHGPPHPHTRVDVHGVDTDEQLADPPWSDLWPRLPLRFPPSDGWSCATTSAPGCSRCTRVSTTSSIPGALGFDCRPEPALLGRVSDRRLPCSLLPGSSAVQASAEERAEQRRRIASSTGGSNGARRPRSAGTGGGTAWYALLAHDRFPTTALRWAGSLHADLAAGCARGIDVVASPRPVRPPAGHRGAGRGTSRRVYEARNDVSTPPRPRCGRRSAPVGHAGVRTRPDIDVVHNNSLHLPTATSQPSRSPC